MRKLDQVQRWMQAVITHAGGSHEGVVSEEAQAEIAIQPAAIETVVTRSRALTALERLDIYNRAYFARLIECLREEFPVLLHALGDEAFDQFAVGYLQKYPSRSYTLNDLGTHFPRYLAESRPQEALDDGSEMAWSQFVIDLATLELTFNQVFDGAGVEGQALLQADDLQRIPPERWPDARLVPVCCLRLLRLDYPVHKYFSAVRKKQNPRLPKHARTHLAVTRRQFVVRRYELSRVQWVLLQALVAGKAVGEAIRLTAETSGPGLSRLADRLHQWFANWTAEGFFQSVEQPE
jgi:hypothetical protein